MTLTEISPQQHLTVLKHLATGKGLDMVAAMTRLTRDQVLDIGNHHGYPSTDKLAWAVDVLTKQLDDDQVKAAVSTATTSPSGVQLVGQPPRPTPARPQHVTAPLEPTPAARPDEFRVLINTAKQHDSKRIQALADRILDDTAKLRGLINSERDRHAAKDREQRQKAEARAEVQRLEKQLADAKAKLRPQTPRPVAAPTRTGDGPSAKDVRAWAAEQGIDCPTRGIVPGRVLEAYQNAHAGDAA